MSVAEYLMQIPAARRARFDQLMALIQETYPDALIDMHYRMPTFYNADKGWCALANQKHYISLYTCGAKNIVDFKLDYPSIHCGKGCINLKDTDALPLDGLQRVIDKAMHASVKCDR